MCWLKLLYGYSFILSTPCRKRHRISVFVVQVWVSQWCDEIFRPYSIPVVEYHGLTKTLNEGEDRYICCYEFCWNLWCNLAAQWKTDTFTQETFLMLEGSLRNVMWVGVCVWGGTLSPPVSLEVSGRSWEPQTSFIHTRLFKTSLHPICQVHILSSVAYDQPNTTVWQWTRHLWLLFLH